MATITLSSKNQITLPVGMVRSLGMKAGDKLDIEMINDRLVIWPKPVSYAEHFIGSMKGYWGTTEQIDRYVAEERASWYENEPGEKARAFLKADTAVSEAARQIVNHLERCPKQTASEGDLFRALPKVKLLVPARDRLVDLGIAEKTPELNEEGLPIGNAYRLAASPSREKR